MKGANEAPPTHQEMLAKAAKTNIQRRLVEAMTNFKREIDNNIKAGDPPLSRKISRAEILRRAGNIDKNTLKASYHEDINKALDAFIKKNNDRHWKLHEKKAINTEERPLGLDHYAQMLLVAETKLEQVTAELKDSLATVEALRQKLAALETQNLELRSKNVTSINAKSKG